MAVSVGLGVTIEALVSMMAQRGARMNKTDLHGVEVYGDDRRDVIFDVRHTLESVRGYVAGMVNTYLGKSVSTSTSQAAKREDTHSQ